MNILCACEHSQRVTEQLRLLGHNAFSCDILPASGSMPEYHLQGDCFNYCSECSDWIAMNEYYSLHFAEGDEPF